MKLISLSAGLVLALAAPAVAQSSEPAVSKRSTIFSADGTKIGRVDTVVPGADGQPSAVRLIYRGKFLTLPVSSLTADSRGFKSSMTTAQIKGM